MHLLTKVAYQLNSLASFGHKQGNEDNHSGIKSPAIKALLQFELLTQVRGVSPCCTMKAVLSFLELYFDDIPNDWTTCLPPTTNTTDSNSSNASDRASLNSHTASFSSDSRGGSSGGGHHTVTSTTTTSAAQVIDDDEDRHFYLLCPKCVLLRHAKPEKISYHQSSGNVKRKAICNKWHNLGSWSRAVTGDYRCTSVDLHMQSNLVNLPDYEHPRLVLVLPPSLAVSTKEWYMNSRVKFLEGFEVHFLCENPTYWHMTENSGFKLQSASTSSFRQHQRPAPTLRKTFGSGGGGYGNHLSTILSQALSMVQVVQGVNEHNQTSRLVAPVVADLIKMYDYLRNVDPHTTDSYAWLTKNKDRVVTMLTKVLANASDGLPDLYFKAGSSIMPEILFQSPSKANRTDLAKFLKIETSSGRFGQLRPLYVGREIRWVCEAHYEELRTIPTK